MTTPALPPPPPAAGECSRHFNPCPSCQREYNDALWMARRQKYEGPETAFWGAVILLATIPLTLACLIPFFLGVASPPLEFRNIYTIGEFLPVFGSFLGLGALGGAFLLYKGIEIWRKNPIDWDNPPYPG